MTNTIETQTWDMINQVNTSVETQTRQTEDNAQAAQAGSSYHSIAKLQQFTKDVVLLDDPQTEQTAVQATCGGGNNKPTLSVPKNFWNALQGVGPREPGLIAIIGAVMCLQARSNSNFWSTMWQQASQSMMMEVQFAPIIGSAIEGQYDAQAAATQSQSEQSRTDGIVSICAFGGAIVMSGVQEWTDKQNPLNQGKDPLKVTDEVKNGAPKPPEDPLNPQNDAEKNLNKPEESFKDRAKRYWNNVSSGFKSGTARFNSWSGKAIQSATAAGLLSEGTTKLFDANYQSKQAMYQAQQGGCQALSQEAEQYAQFYGQSFSRSEDLRQAAQQNLDYAMNILKSAADTITQTTTSMFRG